MVRGCEELWFIVGWWLSGWVSLFDLRFEGVFIFWEFLMCLGGARPLVYVHLAAGALVS